MRRGNLALGEHSCHVKPSCSFSALICGRRHKLWVNKCLLCSRLNFVPTVCTSHGPSVSQDRSGLPGIQTFSVSDRSDHWNYPGYCLQDIGPVPEVINSPPSDLITFSVGSAMQQGNRFNCRFAIPFLKGEILGTFSFAFVNRCHSYTMNAMAMVLICVYILQQWPLGKAFLCLASGWQFGQPFWASFKYDHQMALSSLL